MHPFLRLFQVEDGAALDDLLLMLDITLQHLLERQDLRLAVYDRQHDRAEGRLQLRHHKEMIQHDLRARLALDVDLNMHTVSVGVILDIGDTLQTFFFDKIRDIFDQARLVDAVGDLGDDDLESSVLCLDDLGLCADNDLAATGRVSRADARATHDYTAGRKIGARHTFHDVRDLGVGVVDQQTHRVDGLAEVMRRNVGRHTDRDTVRAVDKQVWEARRQNRRFFQNIVERRHKINGFFIDIREHFRGNFTHSAFCITIRSGRIAVDRTEVSVTVDQHIAHREILRQSDHRVIDGSVAVGMIFTQHFTDGIRAFSVRLGSGDAVLVHTVEDTSVNGLESVPDVRQRARHDNAHRIIEERLAHLAVDIDVDDLAGAELRMLHHILICRLKILAVFYIFIDILVLVIQNYTSNQFCGNLAKES